MTTFPSMPAVLPEGQLGVATITHFDVTPRAAAFTGLRALSNGSDSYVPPGRYAQLKVGSVLMMSDTPMEKRSNVRVVCMARGHVLIAGLGLGMILHPILAKPEVTRVTVVEKYGDVIKLVGPTLPFQEKLELVEADIFTWKPTAGVKYDTLYFDIWPKITGENLAEMARLHQRFGSRKAPGAWMDSWKRQELLSQKRREKSQRQNRGGWW